MRPNETHLWAESYERDLRDVLTLQSEVAQAIARQIRVKLTPLDQARFADARIVDPEAYEAYLKGRYHWNRRSAQAFPKAVQCFQQVISKDPTFAAAYAGLADCAATAGWWGFVAPAEGCGRAKALALKAVELDHALAEAHASLAWSTMLYDHDFVGAEREFERSIELNLRYATAHQWFGLYLAMMGRYEEGFAEVKRALRLDPSPLLIRPWDSSSCSPAGTIRPSRNLRGLSSWTRTLPCHNGVCALHTRSSWHISLAIAAGRKAVELTGNASLFLAILGEAYAAAGCRDEADKVLRQLDEISKYRYAVPFAVGRIYAALGRKDEALQCLEAAYRERSPHMVLLKTDPRLDDLRPDPRFDDLLRRMNYPA